MEFSLFVTQASHDKLTELVKSLEEPAGYGPGKDVRKVEGIPGKYQLITHNGEQNLKNHAVRVHENMIIAGKASGSIEGRLRANKVPFRMYNRVEISKENVNSQTPNIEVPDSEPNIIYNP